MGIAKEVAQAVEAISAKTKKKGEEASQIDLHSLRSPKSLWQKPRPRRT